MIDLRFLTGKNRKIRLKILGKKEQPDYNPEWGIQKRDKYYESIIQGHCGEKRIFSLNQVHGDQFYSTEELHKTKEIPDGDAIFSNRTDEIILVRTADCIPVFFWSEAEDFFGIIHTGWRGLQKDITGKMLLHLQNSGADFSKIVFYVGPCIGKENYEIQNDVASNFPNATKFSLSKKDKGYLFGLSEYLIEFLIKNKFLIKIFQSGICTKENLDFFSHRRGDKGRNLNLIYSEE